MEAHLPTIPDHQQGKFPVVYLVNPDESTWQRLDDSVDAALDAFKKHFPGQLKKPLYVPATKHRRQLQKEKLDQIGTFSDLYQIAAESRRRGWERCLVVDGRTVRQLQGNLRYGEPDEVSLLVIRTELKNLLSDEDGSPVSGDFVAKARRASVAAAVQSVLCSDDDIIGSSTGDDGQFFGDYEDQPWVELHNPNLPPLSADRFFLKPRPDGDSCLILQQRLPPEIVDNILRLVNVDEPLEDLTAAPLRLDVRKSVVIALSLIPLDAEELSRIEGKFLAEMRAKGSDKKLVIYPWLASYDGRRRDLYRLFERTMNNYPGWKTHGWFLFLDRAILASPPRVGIAFGRNNQKLQAQYIMPAQIHEAWESACDIDIMTLHDFLDRHSTVAPIEELHDPQSKYARDLHPFVGDRDMLPVFLLSRHFTEAEVASIQAKFDLDDGIAEISIIPWEQQEDGSGDDICRILQGIDHLYNVSVIIFVDRQTLTDDTVIAAMGWHRYLDEKDPDIPYYFSYLGTQYGRIEAEMAASMWDNVPGNMDWEDFIPEEGTTYVPLPGLAVPQSRESVKS
ncbi:hypothetical protein VTO42DRAFT_358 [Malbranchea cinnamomea]